MGVAVDNGLHRKTVDGFGQSGGAEEGVDLVRLALDGLGDRGVMQDDHGALGPHLPERIFEPHGFLDAFGDHRLDRRFAEGAEHMAAEAAGKALDAGKTDAVDLDRLTFQKMHARTLDDRRHLVHMAAFVIVVAEHADDGDGAGAQVGREQFRLGRFAEIGQVAGEDENVGSMGDLGEEIPVGLWAVFLDMQVADGCDRDLAVAGFSGGCGLRCGFSLVMPSLLLSHLLLSGLRAGRLRRRHRQSPIP